VHRDIIVRIKQAADCRSIFKRFWPNHFRERGNCFCPFHDDSKSSLQVSRELAFCHAENLKLDAVDLYARATGTTNREAVAELAKELGLLKAAGPRTSRAAPATAVLAAAEGLSGHPGRRSHRLVAVYDYTDAEGRLLYQTVRFDPKTFRQRRPGGGWATARVAATKSSGGRDGPALLSGPPASREGKLAVEIQAGGPGSQAPPPLAEAIPGAVLPPTAISCPPPKAEGNPGGCPGSQTWIWNLDGVRRVPYRLPEVIAAETVFVVEGEKDADRLAGLFAEEDQAGGPPHRGAAQVCPGLRSGRSANLGRRPCRFAATTNSEGAGKWRDALSPYFIDKNVVILPDNDEPGRNHAWDVAAKVKSAGAASVKIAELPGIAPKGDISDWLNNGGTKEFLLEIVQTASFFTNANEPGTSSQCERQRKAPFALTDFGNAERFAEQHSQNVRYCHTWGKWLIWSGNHWKVDETAKINQLCKATVRSIYAEASQISDDDRRKAVSKHARASESAGRVQAMLSLAQTEPDIAVTGRDLDTNPWLLNVLNGTLDMRTGELRRHRRSELITKLAPVAYDPAAECPEWFNFLDRIMAGSPGLICYLQKLAGYCLTGDTREKCLPVLHGVGNNGKTIFTATIGAMLGDYARETPVETLMIKRNETIPNDIAGLKGARLVTASEGERGQRLAESLIKRLTGGDKISARFLHQEFFEFVPEFKIVLSTNHKPSIRGTDAAIWSRIHLVPFDVTIPKSEQIPRTVMLERLREEWPGILAWAVEGCLAWQKEGLEKPEEVERATRDYRADSDILGGFISDCCIINPPAKCRSTELYNRYQKWCGDNGEEYIKFRTFGAVLEERGLKRTRLGHKQDRGFQGIGLKLDADTQTNADSFFRVLHETKNIAEKP
jgi:putative DNA primase/helicase